MGNGNEPVRRGLETSAYGREIRKEYGISEYVPYLLAIIQVESGGTAEDVMQSSESMGLPPNSLDTESSIKQGAKYFASLLFQQKIKA